MLLSLSLFLSYPYLGSPSHAPVGRAGSSVDEVDEGVRDAARGFTFGTYRKTYVHSIHGYTG